MDVIMHVQLIKRDGHSYYRVWVTDAVDEFGECILWETTVELELDPPFAVGQVAPWAGLALWKLGARVYARWMGRGRQDQGATRL